MRVLTTYRVYLIFFFLFSTLAQGAALTHHWRKPMKIGSLPVVALEQGGAGDCLFFSIAAAMKTYKPKKTFRITASDIRKRLALYVTEENWEEFLLFAHDSLRIVSGKLKDADWSLVFREQVNFPSEPWKLLKAIVSHMGSSGAYKILMPEEEESFSVVYWGDTLALKYLSMDPWFKHVRLLPLYCEDFSIGEKREEEHEGRKRPSSSAKFYSAEEADRYEQKKNVNILLWWTGGHFQLVGKELDPRFVMWRDRGLLEPGVSFEGSGKFYRVVWPNEQLPKELRDLYSRQFHYRIKV